MTTLFVTTGGRYVDIDGFGCVVAYTELLRLEGKGAQTLLLGPINHSVPKSVRLQKMPYKTEQDTEGGLVIMDVSDPNYLAQFYKLETVVEIFDHHFGFEKYWQEKLGDSAHIDAVGSCTTLVWEAFKNRGFEQNISTLSANLLAMAIVSNTLNFKASVTTTRDSAAFKELQAYIDLPENWIETYFTETEQDIFTNTQAVIANDTKIQEIPNLHKTFVIGQIELWDSRKFIENHQKDIDAVLESFENPDWFMTSPSISEGKNYIYTKSEYIQDLFSKYFDVEFKGNIGTTKKLWMRKEILKVTYEIK